MILRQCQVFLKLQEVLLKQQSTSANLILGSLADASTNGEAHVMDQSSETLGFTLADFNKLVTKAKRINTAWTGGTPDNSIKGITDLIVSPETMEDLRAIASPSPSDLGAEQRSSRCCAGSAQQRRHASARMAGCGLVYEGLTIAAVLRATRRDCLRSQSLLWPGLVSYQGGSWF